MSVGLGDKEIAKHYQSIVSGGDTEWMVLSYDKNSNDTLKVQATGEGGLEEMAEEFMDSRMQYGLIRVKDPNTQLPKFVQINWCGDGVPVDRKGHFYSHSTAVSRYLQGTHVVINARNESDLETALIMKRVNDASGSKYSFHNEKSSAAGPITPVGTSYTPIGQPDINAMRTAPKPAVGAKPSNVASTSTSSYTAPTATTSKPITTTAPVAPSVPSAPRPNVKSSTPAWDDEPASTGPRYVPPSPAPIAPAPPIQQAPAPVQAPVTHVSPPKLRVSTDPKVVDDDRIGTVGTNYVPVSLPKPKKLVNPFAARQAEAEAATLAAQQPSPSFSGSARTPVSATGAKKLTWSDRQALAKKQQAEEEEKSRAASNVSKAAAGSVVGTTVGVGLVSAARVVQDAVEKEEPTYQKEVEEESAPAPPPPPPPPPPPVVVEENAPVEEEVEYPSTVRKPGATHGALSGKVAVVSYDYDATEENEMNLVEGEYIHQIEELDDGWWQGVAASDPNRSGLFPANYVEVVDNPTEEATQDPEPEPEPEVVPPPPPPPPPPPVVVEAPPPAPPAPPPPPKAEQADEGSTAIALYGYDAAEENEITFAEGDRITNINAPSDDWWEGTAPDGQTGLFPANYVELQE